MRSRVIARPARLAELRAALKRGRVVALIGPRRSGKTTLARQIVPADSPNYFDLEDPVSLARLAEPMTTLAQLGRQGNEVGHVAGDDGTSLIGGVSELRGIGQLREDPGPPGRCCRSCEWRRSTPCAVTNLADTRGTGSTPTPGPLSAS